MISNQADECFVACGEPYGPMRPRVSPNLVLIIQVSPSKPTSLNTMHPRTDLPLLPPPPPAAPPKLPGCIQGLWMMAGPGKAVLSAGCRCLGLCCSCLRFKGAVCFWGCEASAHGVQVPLLCKVTVCCSDSGGIRRCAGRALEQVLLVRYSTS